MTKGSRYIFAGAMNSEGIYIAPDSTNKQVDIYDMKYYNKGDRQIELIKTIPSTGNIYSCFFLDVNIGICGDTSGNLISYDLESYTSNIFNQTTELKNIMSCIYTSEGYIVVGSRGKISVLDKEGYLQGSNSYLGDNQPRRISEVRENILLSVELNSCWIHDIRDMGNLQSKSISSSSTYSGIYTSVLTLQSNVGDFALGGQKYSTDFKGYIQILHLDEDNTTLNVLNTADSIEGSNCYINAITEIRKGTIAFGGDFDCTQLCIWDYDASPPTLPRCWDDNTVGSIYDIINIPPF